MNEVHKLSGAVALAAIDGQLVRGALVLGVGFCILLLGAITSPVILIVGALWMLAGAIGWIRIGLLEERAGHGHDDDVEVEHA